MTDNTIDTFRVFNIYTHKVENKNNVHQLSVDKDQALRYYISRINTFMNKFPYSIIRDAMVEDTLKDEIAPLNYCKFNGNCNIGVLFVVDALVDSAFNFLFSSVLNS
jgi:hypothetical protein